MNNIKFKFKLKNVSPLTLAQFIEIIPRIAYLSNDNKYRRLSRYKPYRIILNGKKYYETQNNTEIKASDDDLFCTITYENDRLDKLALKYYNDPTYWWIIAKANNIIDPFDLKIGMILRIPNINNVYSSKGVI